jgi:hypothetical protein
VRAQLGNKPLKIISGYRNPVANDLEELAVPDSRHQYGDAVDVCPPDLNGDNLIDTADRDLLAAAAKDFGKFNEIIKKPLSCVHMANE